LSPDFATQSKATKAIFDGFFFSYLGEILSDLPSSRLRDSLFYSLEAGGKRFRPVLLLGASTEPNQHSFSKNALILASAVECLHTYSLIHDDLPSMDNDDFRRGKPTNHKVFGEATAILAGDALNSLGFFLVSKLESTDAHLISDCYAILHKGVGATGMVQGQWEDLEAEKNPDVRKESFLYSIHAKKTGALIVASLLLGNRLQKDWSRYASPLADYGALVGSIFQIKDDILDEEGEKEEIGKTPGKDRTSGKMTFPSFFGMEKAKSLLQEKIGKALRLVPLLPEHLQSFYQGLPISVVQRKN